MKNVLRITVVVFLSIGSVIMQSCEKDLSTPDLVGLTHSKLTNSNSSTLITSVSPTVVTVTDCNLDGWLRHGAVGALGTIRFVDGPAVPPLGFGSVQFISPDQKFIRLKNNQFVGTLITSISELSFSTYIQQRGASGDNIFIILQIDVNEDGIVDFPLVFNPVFQTGDYVAGIGPDQGAEQMNIWQTWNMLQGVWWRGPSPDPFNGGALFTLATLISQYPKATIANQGDGPGSIRIGGGSPVFTGTFIGYADDFTIGIIGNTTRFDFEGGTANAGPDQTVNYGYGLNCTTLQGSALGGVGPYTYSWSPGGSPINQANTEVCPSVTTTYVLMVTDANGCISTDNVTVFVNDLRCGNNLNKVKVCHKGAVICVATEDVPNHLAHGDSLGTCVLSL